MDCPLQFGLVPYYEAAGDAHLHVCCTNAANVFSYRKLYDSMKLAISAVLVLRYVISRAGISAGKRHSGDHL
jgi:hypothetical protein